MANLIIDCKIAQKDADLSKIPAYKDDQGNFMYWDSLTKEVARKLWDHGNALMAKYEHSTAGAEILGCLEDTYPDWVTEFEDSL